MRGFERPIAKVVALALVLAAVSAAAPLAVMRLVDVLTAVAATAPGRMTGDTGRTVLVALGLVARAELAQVWLARLLAARSWRVRLDMDFALRQRVTARLHELPLTWHQQHTVGGTVSRVNTSINGFVSAVGDLAFNAVPAIGYLALAVVALLQLDWRLALGRLRVRAAAGRDRHARAPASRPAATATCWPTGRRPSAAGPRCSPASARSRASRWSGPSRSASSRPSPTATSA